MSRQWDLHRVRFPQGVVPQYFVETIRQSADSGRLSAYFTGVGIKHLTGKSLGSFVFPLPPLAEQHRIVAKVDELMTLCDRLEVAQAEREKQRDCLVEASLHRLNQPSDTDAPETFREHARFYLNHLPRLTTRVEHIKQLRNTISGLAVTGRLTQHRTADGSAQDLLSRFRRARRGARNGRRLLEACEPQPPLPETWAWATIDEVADEDENAITDGPFGANLKTAHYIQTPGFRVIRLQNIGRGYFRAEHRSYIDQQRFDRLAKHWVFAGDLVVAGLVDPLVRRCEVPGDIGPALVKADCCRFKVHPKFSSRFVMHYLNSPVCQRFAAVHHHGMTLVRIGLGNFRRIPIPVPPPAEQQRIVAKVEALMALCDQLEAKLAESQTESRRLLEAILHEALAPAALQDSMVA